MVNSMSQIKFNFTLDYSSEFNPQSHQSFFYHSVLSGTTNFARMLNSLEFTNT